MARGPGGTYQAPTGNPVIPGTVITADWANPLVTDLGNEITDSLSRSGKGGMVAALRGLNGDNASPTYSFTNAPSTGRFLLPPGQVIEVVDGNKVMKYDSGGVYQWTGDQNTGDWTPLTPRDALGTPFDPAPTNLTSTNVQDAIEEVNVKAGAQEITADAVSYDASQVYFPAATVQLAIDRLGADMSSVINDIIDLDGDIETVAGDVLLLEGRMTTTETRTSENTNAILILDTIVQDNSAQIDAHSANLSTINDDQLTQDSRISGAEDWTQFNWGRIQGNETDISALQEADTILEGRVAQNEAELDVFEHTWFGGNSILKTIYGGTGVTNQTGTGATVHRDSAVLVSADIYSANMIGGTLNTDVFAVTQGLNNSSTRIATTAFVDGYSEGFGDTEIQSASNTNGWWVAIRVKGSVEWKIFQWGREFIGSPSVIKYPLSTASSTSTQVNATIISGGSGGGPSAIIINFMDTIQFQASTQYGYQCTFQIMALT